jgi:hypothetical protein
MTAAERSARRHERVKDRIEQLEAALRDLLAEAETGIISPKYVAERCRSLLLPSQKSP